MFTPYIRTPSGRWKVVPVLWHDCAWRPRILLRVAAPICRGRFRSTRFSTSLPKGVFEQKRSRVIGLPRLRPFCIFVAPQSVSRISNFSTL